MSATESEPHCHFCGEVKDDIRRRQTPLGEGDMCQECYHAWLAPRGEP